MNLRSLPLAIIRALAPADYVAVRREDMEHEMNMCSCEAPWDSEKHEFVTDPKHRAGRIRLRTALSRAGKGE